MLEAAMLLTAIAVDLTLGEPPARIHPVVWIGKFIAALERLPIRSPRLQLAHGALMPLVGILVFVGPAWLVLDYLRQASPPAYFLLGTFLLKSTFSIRGLFRATEGVRRPLAAGDLPQARAALRSLVSRDTASLGGPLVAAAAVESVAENTSDSIVAPLFFFVLLGLPGALAYRVINTFDAMVGYHGRYEYLGKASARLDDLANLVPARVTALILVLAGFLSGNRAGPAWRTMRRYCGATESPNAGWPMSAMAGALGVRLEKVGHYCLGDGTTDLTADTVAQANGIARVSTLIVTAISVALLVVKHVHFS